MKPLRRRRRVVDPRKRSEGRGAQLRMARAVEPARAEEPEWAGEPAREVEPARAEEAGRVRKALRRVEEAVLAVEASRGVV